MANGALRTVKDRPVATSGVLAALVIFLAREPLWRLASGFLGENEDDVDAGTIEDDLDHHDKGYDLTAPTIGRSKKEGVKRSEEHTSELQSLMRISYPVFCLKKKKNT